MYIQKFISNKPVKGVKFKQRKLMEISSLSQKKRFFKKWDAPAKKKLANYKNSLQAAFGAVSSPFWI